MAGSSVLKKNRTLVAFALIAPAFIIYLIIIIFPVIQTAILSFYKWNGINPVKQFIGLANYKTAIMDTNFQTAFKNNIIWMSFFITMPIVLALFIGLALTKKGIYGRDIFQALFFIPHILSTVVISVIWKIVYSPNVGLLSWVMQSLHLIDKPYGLLGDPNRALFGLIFANVWSQFGFCTIIYINGLQNVDPELYDAANMDGVNPWQRLWNVTLPGISAVTTMLVLNNLINSFKTFNYVYLMTHGGPMAKTEVVAYRIYEEAFQLNRFGYGSALAIILSIIVCGISVVYVRFRDRKDVV
jgi:ABC-type sugar transport system permease subunit